MAAMTLQIDNLNCNLALKNDQLRVLFENNDAMQ